MAQRILVTAGAAGIGLAVARAFAAGGGRGHVAGIGGPGRRGGAVPRRV